VETEGLTRNGSPESQMATVGFLMGRGVGLAKADSGIGFGTSWEMGLVAQSALAPAATACVAAMNSETGLKTSLGVAVGRPKFASVTIGGGASFHEDLMGGA